MEFLLFHVWPGFPYPECIVFFRYPCGLRLAAASDPGVVLQYIRLSMVRVIVVSLLKLLWYRLCQPNSRLREWCKGGLLRARAHELRGLPRLFRLRKLDGFRLVDVQCILRHRLSGAYCELCCRHLPG